MLEQAGGHNRVELPALHLLRFHLLLHLLWQPRLQALFYLTEDEQIKNEKKTSQKLRMLSPSLFIQGPQCNYQYCCSQLSEMKSMSQVSSLRSQVSWTAL